MASIMRTRIEEDYGHPVTDAEWAVIDEMNAIASRLADHCCERINALTGKLPREPVTYNQQWTLEKLIGILEARV